MNISKETFLVLGLGRSGLATVKWLRRLGARVMVYDDHNAHIQDACDLGALPFPDNPTRKMWLTIRGLVQSPGVACTHPYVQVAQASCIPVYSDADLFCQAYPDAKIIGITGTNGKSTTTHLLTHILKSCGVSAVMGGNVGIPILSHAFNQNTWYIWELSSYQLEISQHLNLTYAGWLNISEDHLARHKTMDAYVRAKEKIFTPSVPTMPTIQATHQRIEGVIVVEDAWSQAVGMRYPHVHRLKTSESPIRLPHNAALQGAHNYENTCVAYHLAQILGLDDVAIHAAIATFPGVEHRQEIVTTFDGVTFVNDSKATNANSAEKALAMYEKVVWIVGGEPKSDGIVPLSAYFPKVSKAFLIGQSASNFSCVFQEHNVPYQVSHTVEQAVPEAFHWAQQNGISTVLFSPACASFDQFDDFEHRGRVFKICVHTLMSQKKPEPYPQRSVT